MFTKVLVSLFTKTSVFTYYSITKKLSANYINYLLVINSVCVAYALHQVYTTLNIFLLVSKQSLSDIGDIVDELVLMEVEGLW